MRRWPLVLATFLATVAATALLTARMKPVYEARARLLLDNPSANGAPPGVADLLRGIQTSGSLDVEIEKMRSQAFLAQVLRIANVQKIPDDLTGRLTLTGKENRILDILVRAPQPAEARDTANAVGIAYINQLDHDADDVSEKTRLRLQKAEDQARREKDSAVDALRRFEETTGISDPATYFKERTLRTVQVQTALEQTRNDLQVQKERRRALEAQIKTVPPQVTSNQFLDRNQLINSQRSEIALLQAERRMLLEDFAPDSNEVKLLDTKIATRQGVYDKALADPYSNGTKQIVRNPQYVSLLSDWYTTRLGLRTNEKAIGVYATQLAALKDEQLRITRIQRRLEQLRRDYESANARYNRTRDAQGDIALKQATMQSYARIFDPARLPTDPVSPNTRLNLALALFLGLFLGIGVALVVEYVTLTEEPLSPPVPALELQPGLPQVGGVPILGALPVQALPAPLATALPAPIEKNTARFEDGLREIGYVLAHRSPGQATPVALFVGSQSDDAVATLLAHVAAVLVRDHVRVTLVDADRVSPRLNRVFGKPDAPGLADVLSGRCQVRDILHTAADGRLRFLAAGSPDDPAVLTESGLKQVLIDLTEGDQTDLVLLSGPAVWNARAVNPLERAAGGIVLVTSPDVPAAETVARARRLLTNGYTPHIQGVVLTERSDVLAETAEENTV